MSFQDYLKNREQAFSSLKETLKQDTMTESRSSDNIWKPVMGKDGTGYAVIRFLPGKDSNKAPFVKLFSHGFQGPTGKWYIENSLTTLGQKDPVSEYNSRLWNSGIEADKDQVRKQKRRTSYYANILVVKDPANPQNEGQVMLYRFGQKIFDKIMGALQPEFADEQPLNPFDIFEGANFRVKLKTVGGYWNYDSSDFERPSPISEDESRLEAIFEAQTDVHDLIAEDQFKSYDELNTHMHNVLELNTTSNEPVAAPPTHTSAPAPNETKEEFAGVFEKPPTASTVTSEADDLESYFKNLAS